MKPDNVASAHMHVSYNFVLFELSPRIPSVLAWCVVFATISILYSGSPRELWPPAAASMWNVCALCALYYRVQRIHAECSSDTNQRLAFTYVCIDLNFMFADCMWVCVCVYVCVIVATHKWGWKWVGCFARWIQATSWNEQTAQSRPRCRWKLAT